MIHCPLPALTRFSYEYILLSGITTLFAVSIIEKKMLDKLADFKKRITWFENYRIKNNKFWPNEERTDGKRFYYHLFRRNGL